MPTSPGPVDCGLVPGRVRRCLPRRRHPRVHRQRAGFEIARGWRQLTSVGRFETLQALLDALGSDRRTLTAPLACVEAISASMRGLEREVSERHLAVAERAPWQGPTPDGLEDISVAIAMARAPFIGTDLSRSMDAARVLVGRQAELPYVDAIGRSSLAMCLVLAGDPHAAIGVLEPLGDLPGIPLVVLHGRAARSLASTLAGDPASGWRPRRSTGRVTGASRARRGWRRRLAFGLACSTGTARGGQPWLERALAYWGVPAGSLPVRTSSCGWRRSPRPTATTSARSLVREARAILAGSADPGALPRVLAEVERTLDMRSKRRLAEGDMPTEAEMRVLRLLAGPSSHSAIAREPLPVPEYREDPRQGGQSQARDLHAGRGRVASTGAGPALSRLRLSPRGGTPAG